MGNEDNVIDVEAEEIQEVDDPSKGKALERWHPAQYSEEWWQWASPEIQANRCSAHSSRTGLRCRRPSIAGARVCRAHGGAAKHVKQAARARLDNAADVMVKRLLQLAQIADDPVALRAVDSALDRTLGKPVQAIAVGPAEPKPWEEVYEGITTMSRDESRRARGLPDASDNLAGVDSAHLHASSQEGTECQSCNPPTQSDSPGPDDHGDTRARRESFDPTAYPNDDDYLGDPAAPAQHEASYSPDSPMHRSRPREFDRDRQSESRRQARSPLPHITGDVAMRIANETNRAIGALPPMPELESPHKRYPRP